MNILITGGAGYIGSVMSRVFLSGGHNVTVLDNLRMGNEDAVPSKARFIQGDIADFENLVKESDRIEAVIHLAAFMSAGESMQVPEQYWYNNVVGTLAMLDAMRKLDIRKMVFASSAAVYGNPTQIPIIEDAPKNPTNTYGMTKLAMDMAITSESWVHGLAATSLRFFNVAGAYEDAGERHSPETHIIPLVLDVAAGKREAFTIFGDDYDTPDGTCIRDYIHVEDLTQAALLALNNQKSGEHDIYNLGNGNGFSNKELVAAVEKVTGANIKVNFGDRREGDPAILIASSERAQSVLGWQPKHRELESIITDAWNFYRSGTTTSN
jgi:UDP-glucose 4-epimerase